MKPPSPLGVQVRKRRIKLDWSLDQLAEKSKISKGNLSKIENSPEANPSLYTLRQLAKAFGVRIHHLL